MNPDLQHLLIFTGIAIAGMFAHYAKSWAKGEISGNLVDYLFRDNPRATVLSLGGVLTAVATTWLTSTLNGMSLQQLLLAGFTTGFTIDSTLNKGGAAIATPAAAPAQKQGGFARVNLLFAAAALSSLALFVLPGCASTPAPQTPAESIVYVEAAAASADSLADRLYLAGSITKAEAQGVLRASRALQAAVQTAKALLASGDGGGAQAQLQAVQADLQLVTAFLTTHQ